MPSRFEDQWRERFARFARSHDDEALIAGWTRTGLATRLRQFRRVARESLAGELWLDAGCGAGTYSRELASRGARVVGFDYSEPTIARALERPDAEVLYAVADVTRLPVRDGRFDGVISFGVTQALSESRSLIQAISAAARLGGEVWVDALNAYCLPHLVTELMRRLRGAPPRLRYERPGTIVSLLREGGAQSIVVIWMPMLPQRLSRVQAMVERPPIRWLIDHVPMLGALVCHSFIVRGVISNRVPLQASDPVP